MVDANLKNFSCSYEFDSLKILIKRNGITLNGEEEED